MQTSNRVRYLTNYIPKTQISVYLEINRKTLDFYIENPRWKKYQVKKVNELFDYVKKLTQSKEVKKIYFKNGCLIADVVVVKELY